ncbi:Glycosyl hydrolase superfamily protein [Forsythia ovata]|uniref:Chitinase domain-containing protein 1 n=1 Tax=Forsythia ovata TaxID=205694 RepID=A0ABD1PZQ9_9LAMI
MAKTRDRRVGLSSYGQSSRVGSSTRKIKVVNPVESPPRHSDHKLITASSAVFLFFIVSSAISVILYRKLYASNAHTNMNTGSDLPYVYQRGLVKTDIHYHQVLAENMKLSENSSHRNFKNPVLAYITPWNSKGYDKAKKFNNKFTHLSPVWYELKSQDTKLVMDGRHNADKEWIAELRMKGDALVLPRVVLEAHPVDLLKKKKQRNKAVNLIITECKEMGYDGIVLESWSRWAAYGVLHDPEMRNMALQFIQQLGQAMHSISLEHSRIQNLQLVYVVGPPRSDKLEEYDIGPEDVRRLSEAVDGFSVMTYDFSGPQNPGPNAPLKWIRFTLQLLLDGTTGDRQKFDKRIFVGINFYGNDFIISGGGGPILGTDYLSLLERHKPALRWEENSAEHFFVYADNQNVEHVVFYPSLKSIAVRLEEALSWGAGIAIWEIGQGLDYFFDML